jgi:glycosyltransferase involved in cell wall biosynthesis
MIELSVVCPAFQEEACIGDTLDRLSRTLEGSGLTWQLVVVDDGSTDRTLERARACAGPNVDVVTYPRNRGRGHALRRGFDAARGRVIVATEADLSWGSDVVLALHAAIDDRTDVAIASPYVRGGALVNVPRRRAWLSRMGNLALAPRFGVAMSTGMTRAYRAEALRRMRLSEDDKDLHLQILAESRRLALRVREIPAVLEWPRDRSARTGSVHAGHIARHLAWALGLT